MKLSIIIPTLNEASYLETAVETAISRAGRRPHEVIVADCGSTDGTAELAGSLGARVVNGPLLRTAAPRRSIQALVNQQETYSSSWTPTRGCRRDTTIA